MGSHTLSASTHAMSPGMSPARSVMDSLRRLVHGLRVFDRSAEQSAGLSGAQLFVLSRLAAGGAASVNELADRTCTHQSSVSVVARKLVERGLARRGRWSGDGRVVQLSITPAGQRALEGAPAAAQEKLIGAIGRLKPEDRQALARIMEQLVAAAGLEGTRPALFFEDHRNGHANEKDKLAGHRKQAGETDH